MPPARPGQSRASATSQEKFVEYVSNNFYQHIFEYLLERLSKDGDEADGD
jgi:hypothetical protein